MPGMMYNYNTIFPSSPIFCSPLPVVPLPITPISQDTLRNSMTCQNSNTSNDLHKLNQINNSNSGIININSNSNGPMPQFQRPASQATSVKAEPGSALGSIASASIANKVSWSDFYSKIYF